jgi:hypothetical protein
LQNNPNAFAMTERQKIEGAAAVHLEETRVKMMMAIGQAPPLDDAAMLRHLHEYALEVGSWISLRCDASYCIVNDCIVLHTSARRHCWMMLQRC